MQKKLPLANSVLQAASALDPEARGHSLALQFLKQIQKLVTNVLSDVETDSFLQEVHRYNVNTLPPSSAADGTPLRINQWWTKVSEAEKYPAFAMLSCFHCPRAEGSFSTMGDVIDPKSCRINFESYSAIQTVKYGLRAGQKTAIEKFTRTNYLHEEVDTTLCRNLRSSAARYKAHLTEKMKEQEEAKERLKLHKEKLQSKKTAKTILEEAEKKARLIHAKNFKRRQKLSAMAAEVNMKRKKRN